MNSSNVKSNPNPQEKDSLISNLVWWWTKNIFEKGYKSVLSLEDLYDPIEYDVSASLGDELEKQWNIQLSLSREKKRKPSLTKAVFHTFRRHLLINTFIHIFFEFCLSLPTPIFLGLLVESFQLQTTTNYVILYAGVLAAIDIFQAFVCSNLLFSSLYLAGRLRVALTSLTYRKALRLSKTALGETSPGKIVNLMSTDIDRFPWVFYYVNYLWTAPLILIFIGFILYMKIGVFAFVGIILNIILAIVPAFNGSLQRHHRKQMSIKSDQRIRLINEIISGMQIVKMYAWEKPLCTLVEMARKLELQINRKLWFIRNIMLISEIIAPRLALYCTVIVLLFCGQRLTFDDLYSLTLFYYILGNTFFIKLMSAISYSLDNYIAFQRIECFLMLEEFNPHNVLNINLKSSNFEMNPTLPNGIHPTQISSKSEDIDVIIKDNNTTDFLAKNSWAVNFENTYAKWNLASSNDILENINLKLEKGKLYVVIGLVGSGKSSLLSTILGEMHVVHGHIKTEGRLTYTDQEAWIFGDTVRQNILFGESFDEDRYNKTIQVCSLIQDLEQLPNGDLSTVGEKGISLSGGQKARISLARAIYRQADIYLLDDPLSAVDSHVANQLFEKCITQYLNGKTRILATHQLQFIKNVDGIILIKQGKVTNYINYQQLLDKHPEYLNFLSVKEKITLSEKTLVTANSHSSTKYNLCPPIFDGTSDIQNDNHDSRKLENKIEESLRKDSKVNLILKYFQMACSAPLVSIMAILFIATQCLATSNDLYLPYLVKVDNSLWNSTPMTVLSNSTVTTSSITIGDAHSYEMYIYAYSGIILLLMISTIMRTFAYIAVCFRSCQRLHNKALKALMQTTLKFFNKNPSGRIINRFSKETAVVDDSLTRNLQDTAHLFLTISAALLITCILRPIFCIPAVVIIILCCLCSKFCLKTSKITRRLDVTTRAPVFTHLNETLNGIATVRAQQAECALKKEFDKLQDINTSAWYTNIACNAVYNLIIKIFVSSFVAITIFISVCFSNYFSELEVGLIISQLICVSAAIQMGMVRYAEFVTACVSIEHILEYIKLPPENNLRLTEKRSKRMKDKHIKTTNIVPRKDWPNEGYLKFTNVSMRYSIETEPVIKNFNFHIKPTEKVGIVGRTGAGKSSLISAILRLADIEGIIEIDGFDTESVALETLRRHISIIPQDPVLFSGTLRRNLDPFEEFSDESLWKSLEEVKLKDTISMFESGLNYNILHKGSNFSIGQRQLICLARAILRKNRFLIMDEATANVDLQTDALIQQTIRVKFNSCTVLTVAHRLNTIIDSDRVMVIDSGKLVEFDHPYNLLQINTSLFTKLVKETGELMFQKLLESAEQYYYENNSYL